MSFSKYTNWIHNKVQPTQNMHTYNHINYVFVCIPVMKEIKQMSKRRRVVYSVEMDDKTRFAAFCVKYLTYLLQALMHGTTSIKLSSGNNEGKNLDIRKKVRLEIDMAMVVSVGTHFKWTKTLKQKLEDCQWRVPIMTGVMEICEQRPILLECHHVPISLNYLSVQIRGSEKRRTKLRKSEMEAEEREEVRQCIELLSELVPIGEEELSMKELMGEVVSYVTCLQFQVGALRSLLSSTSNSTSDSGIKYK